MNFNLLFFAFLGIFILFLIESIYFFKKNLSSTPQAAKIEQESGVGKMVLIGAVIITLLIIVSLGWLIFSRQKTSTEEISTNINPTQIPTQLPSVIPTQLVYISPVSTEITHSPTPTKIASVKGIPTKTPTPIKIPTATPTKRVTYTPTPSKIPPIGGPNEITSPAPSLSPTGISVIVPKIPVAGFPAPLFTFLFLALTSLVVGLIL